MTEYTLTGMQAGMIFLSTLRTAKKFESGHLYEETVGILKSMWDLSDEEDKEKVLRNPKDVLRMELWGLIEHEESVERATKLLASPIIDELEEEINGELTDEDIRDCEIKAMHGVNVLRSEILSETVITVCVMPGDFDGDVLRKEVWEELNRYKGPTHTIIKGDVK